MSQPFVSLGDRIVVTGASGFIGRRVVATLLTQGFTNVVAFVRPTPTPTPAEQLFGDTGKNVNVNFFRGDLLSPSDCRAIATGTKVLIHLAAGRGEKSYPDAFLNTVVTTRNLLAECVRARSLLRFVNISSFAVYSNHKNPHGRLLDESAPVDTKPLERGQAYCYAKIRQEELVQDYGRKNAIPYVILRPGLVYGPGNEAIHSRVGIGTFGIFLHCGGSNRLPLSYVDNCADAIVLAATTPNIDGEIFNVVDDDLPTCRQFLRGYKRNVRRFKSIYIPHALSYLSCLMWEKYSAWSNGQLPPVFNRGTWRANWKRTLFTNQKLKIRLSWTQRIPTAKGVLLHFESCIRKQYNA